MAIPLSTITIITEGLPSTIHGCRDILEREKAHLIITRFEETIMVMHHLSPASTILLTRLPRTPVDSLHMQHHLLHIISSHAMILTCGLTSPEAQHEMRRRPPPASRHLTMVVCKSTQDSCEPLGHFANKDRYFLTIHLLPAPDIFSWTICQAIYDP